MVPLNKKNGNKYLPFTSTDKNKEVLEKYSELWDGIKSLIEKINSKPGKYGKDYMKIRFNSDNNWPLNKLLTLHMFTVIVRSVFQEDGKYYSQIFLDECLYEKFEMKKLMFQKKLTLIKQMNQKNDGI